MTRPCGDAGYYLRFAYPYCRRFLDNVRPDFSVKGQEWLDRVAVCLQQKTELLPDSLSCHELETQAIASHPECYISTGFCEQSFGMKLRILSVIFPEVKDPRILRAGIEILEKCGERQRELSAKRAQ